MASSIVTRYAGVSLIELGFRSVKTVLRTVERVTVDAHPPGIPAVSFEHHAAILNPGRGPGRDLLLFLQRLQVRVRHQESGHEEERVHRVRRVTYRLGYEAAGYCIAYGPVP